MRIHRRSLLAVWMVFVCGAFLSAQEAAIPQPRVFVNFVSASSVVVSPGHSTPVQFTFHVEDPYHINSNQPLAAELIPTQVHFSLPGEIAIGRMQYPAGKLMSFPFDPSTKLSVYSGNLVVSGIVVAPAAASSDIVAIDDAGCIACVIAQGIRSFVMN